MIGRKQPIAIDLFAGAGGFGLGFEMAGFSVPLSVEIDAWASDTLRYNRTNMTVVQNDIRDQKLIAAIDLNLVVLKNVSF